MLNHASVTAVDSSAWGRAGAFRRPLYDSYGFARLPATIELLLTGDAPSAARGLPADVLGPAPRRYRTVVLILVDAFGWHLFGRYAADLPFLKRFLDSGVVSKLTAQFPSTTAAHLTTLHTGLPVSRTGVLEWFYYEPVADAVIAPLLFSVAGDHQRETLRARGVRPEDVFPSPTLYQRLADRGVDCAVYQDAGYARTSYSTHLFAGARVVPFTTVAEGLTRLADDLLGGGAGRPRYCVLYLDTVDAHGHAHGLGSPEFVSAVARTFAALEGSFYQRVAGKMPDALLLLTADHGLTRVDPPTTVYLNAMLPNLPGLLRTTRGGEPIRFGGSGRDLFLYVRDEHLDALEARLSELLAGRAEVWRTRDLAGAGLFGPGPFDRLLPRAGDLAVLPYAGQTVYWLEEGRFAMKHMAAHGGLTPEEMDTVLGALGL